MSSEFEKGKVEIKVFKRFAKLAGLRPERVEKQSAEEGKPDLKCIIDGEVVYFELTEACSEELAKSITHHTEEQLILKVKDYTSSTYRKKIAKSYPVNEPVELLIYNIGRTPLSDDVLVKNIREIAQQDKGQFRKVWYFGKYVSELSSNGAHCVN